MRRSFTAFVLMLLPTLMLSSAEPPVQLRWEGPSRISFCKEESYKLWFNLTEDVSNVRIKVNITKDLECTGNNTNLPPSVEFSERDGVLEGAASRLRKGEYFLEFRLKPKCGAGGDSRALYAEIEYDTKKENDSLPVTIVAVNASELTLHVSIEYPSNVTHVKSKINGTDVKPEVKGHNLDINIMCGSCSIANLTIRVPILIAKDLLNSSRLNVSIIYEKVDELNITMIPQYKKLFTGGRNFSKPIVLVNLSDFLDLIRTKQRGEVLICANGTSKGIVVTYCRIYDLSVEELRIDTSIPYLIIVRGYDGAKHPYLSVEGSGAYSKVQLGDSLLLIFYQDFFVPSYKEVSVEFTYFHDVSDTKIVIAYGFERRNVIGGVGTLTLALLTFLLALVTVVARRWRTEAEVAKGREEEEEELLIDLG